MITFATPKEIVTILVTIPVKTDGYGRRTFLRLKQLGRLLQMKNVAVMHAWKVWNVLTSTMWIKIFAIALPFLNEIFRFGLECRDEYERSGNGLFAADGVDNK